MGLSPVVPNKQHRASYSMINKTRTAEKTCYDLMGRFYVPSSGCG
jgi:hypothetical protein